MDPSSSTKFHKIFAAIFQHTEKYNIGVITGSVITGMKCLEVKYKCFYTVNYQRLFIWSTYSDFVLPALVEVLDHRRQL